MSIDIEKTANELKQQAYGLLKLADDLLAKGKAEPAPDPQPEGLLSVRQFCQKHRGMTEGGMRHVIFYAEEKGFEECIVRFGRRVLLDEARVMEWLRSGGLSRGGLKRRAS